MAGTDKGDHFEIPDEWINGETPPVPDYVARQMNALNTALEQGDPHAMATIVNHMVAEAGVDSDSVIITLFFKATMEALMVGDQAKAQRLQNLMAATFPPEAIRANLARTLLATGHAAGALDAKRYDQLQALLRDTDQDPEVWAMFATIVRVDEERRP